jgi:hypothetical protein
MAPIGQKSPATAIAHGRCPCALITTNPYDQLDLDGYSDAIKEYVPLECRSEGESDASSLEDSLELAMADVACSRAKGSAQGERRVKVGLGDADLSALRHRRQFGRASIRPPADEISGNADRDGFWRNRDPARPTQ